MKRLTKYQKNGSRFDIYCRSGNLAIFHGKSYGEGQPETWDVIRIQTHPGMETSGKHYAPAEYPPSQEQYGTHGWTFASPEAARDRFEVEVGKLATKEMNEDGSLGGA